MLNLGDATAEIAGICTYGSDTSQHASRTIPRTAANRCEMDEEEGIVAALIARIGIYVSSFAVPPPLHSIRRAAYGAMRMENKGIEIWLHFSPSQVSRRLRCPTESRGCMEMNRARPVACHTEMTRLKLLCDAFSRLEFQISRQAC